ncbi:hypothetical protein AKJ16_DCAP01905 [Drosera capensis]
MQKVHHASTHAGSVLDFILVSSPAFPHRCETLESQNSNPNPNQNRNPTMKVAPKLILLFNDPAGVGAAIHAAIIPNPNSPLQRSEESFERSLEGYGIGGEKASGEAAHLVDRDGELVVTVLLMGYHEPPVLACAINEVLHSIKEENQSTALTLILPFVLPATKLKIEEKIASVDRKKSIYGAQLGPETDFTRSAISKTQKLPSLTQIHYEPLACLLQFVHVLNVPAVLLIGQIGQHLHNEAVRGELETLHELGELLASSLHLSFVKDRVKLNQGKTSKAAEEPWRALYG